MKKNDDVYEIIREITYWDLILLLPLFFLNSHLPGDSFLDIFINVLIIIFVMIGIFATTRFIKSIYQKNKHN